MTDDEAKLSVDAVVLDVDGVLVDVADSYRRAIVESIATVYGETIPREAIQQFKDAGGFNDDWELTYAGALYVLARQNDYDQSIDAYTSAIAEAGGGLAGAYQVLEEALSTDTYAFIESRLDTDQLRDVFQQLYLGADLYRKLEGGEPAANTPGYINDEEVLIDPTTIERLTAGYDVGVLTGRPAAEAEIALDRVGLSIPAEYRITMDDPVPGKPDPAGLGTLADRFDAASIIFVGDTLDDIRTVQHARDEDSERDYYSAGVLTGGLTSESGRKLYEEEGADLVCSDINAVPHHLS